MPVLYPSQEWCAAWRKAMNESAAVKKTGKNWGVGFNGCFVFEILPGAGLEKTTYVFVGAAAGECSEACIIAGPQERDAGFICSGPYQEYKAVVRGQKDFVAGVLRGTFKIKGDMAQIMRNAPFIRAVANSISSFEASYLGE